MSELKLRPPERLELLGEPLRVFKKLELFGEGQRHDFEKEQIKNDVWRAS
jgi:hypothetical protein